MLGSRMHEDVKTPVRPGANTCMWLTSKEWTVEFNVRQVEFVRIHVCNALGWRWVMHRTSLTLKLPGPETWVASISPNQ